MKHESETEAMLQLEEPVVAVDADSKPPGRSRAYIDEKTAKKD